MKQKILKTIFQNKFTGLIFIIFLFSIFTYLPFDWNKSIKNFFIDVQFKIRGPRHLSDKIFIVFIGDEDINALGGWPITRDYYGYLTHILKSMGARTIGIDILFKNKDFRHPEFDTNMADFFQAANNVCLPFTFPEIQLYKFIKSQAPLKLFRGINPTFPIHQFKQAAKGLGFSNFSNEAIIRKVPIIVTHNDTITLSFGFQLARQYLGMTNKIELKNKVVTLTGSNNSSYSNSVDINGRLRLNYFGDIKNLNTISFIDLLQIFESNPDSLNLRNKLVIVAATAPGISVLRPTPLSNLLPATLIHATIAENIIEQKYIKEIPNLFQCLIIILLLFTLWLFLQSANKKIVIISSSALLIIYWILSAMLFNSFNFVLPLFYPTIAYFSLMIYISVQQGRIRRIQENSMKKLLKKRIDLKENRLNDAKEKLEELQHQLEQETTVSEKNRQVVINREKAILDLEKELSDLKTYIIPKKQKIPTQFDDIIYDKTSKMANVLDLVCKVASDNIPILIMGETGTGKEMIAQAIHQTSKRKDAIFIAINCGALSETLLESELFGHEKGSFTGAHARRRGRFEIANGGTIFLDEITETTPKFQTRLLRVLQESCFERIGGEQTLHVNVRIIAATNKELQSEMEQNRFRSDLFYRLNGFPIMLPALRERTVDIPLLADFLLKKHKYENINAFSDRTMEILKKYHWPGNVRELENVIRRAAILAQSEGRNSIRENDLPDEILKQESVLHENENYKSLELQILESLRVHKFSRSAISQTAKALGNRDRGTITEYYRGICFENLIEANFSVEEAATQIADSTDELVQEKVCSKINYYLNNLRSNDFKKGVSDLSSKNYPSIYKGLPKKFHPALQRVLEYITNDKVCRENSQSVHI